MFLKWLFSLLAAGRTERAAVEGDDDPDDGCKTRSQRKRGRHAKTTSSLILRPPLLTPAGSILLDTAKQKRERRVSFNLISHTYLADEWDRRQLLLTRRRPQKSKRAEADDPWLTPASVYMAKLELNRFKCGEMLVHRDSLHNTLLYLDGSADATAINI